MLYAIISVVCIVAIGLLYYFYNRKKYYHPLIKKLFEIDDWKWKWIGLEHRYESTFSGKEVKLSYFDIPTFFASYHVKVGNDCFSGLRGTGALFSHIRKLLHNQKMDRLNKIVGEENDRNS